MIAPEPFDDASADGVNVVTGSATDVFVGAQVIVGAINAGLTVNVTDFVAAVYVVVAARFATTVHVPLVVHAKTAVAELMEQPAVFEVVLTV